MPDTGHIHTIVEGLRAFHVPSERDDEMTLHLDRLFRCDAAGVSIPTPVRFGRTGETRAILNVAGPGEGKSYTIHRALSLHPAMMPRSNGSIPWILATVPSPASLKSMVFALLKATGYGLERSRRSVWELVEILRDRLHDFGIVVIWM